MARDDGSPYSDPTQYRRLVGRLIYLPLTCPDLAYVVHVLAQFMHSPQQHHWDAALRIIRCLKGSPGRGIALSSSNDSLLGVIPIGRVAL